MDFNDYDLNFSDDGGFVELSLTQGKIPLPKHTLNAQTVVIAYLKVKTMQFNTVEIFCQC